MEPPRPWLIPVSFANISAITNLGSVPHRAMAPCPLKLTKAILLEREQVEPAVLQAVEEEEEKHVQEMLKFSLESEYPGIETATTYTYADREVELR